MKKETGIAREVVIPLGYTRAVPKNDQGSVRRRLVVLTVIVFACLLIHIGLGSSVTISPIRVLQEIFAGPKGPGDTDNWIIWQLRLPRALAAVCTGGILGLVGCAFQALFRNPLVEPYTVGASSGAAVGGALALIFGLDHVLGPLALPLAGFLTGMLSLGLVLSLSRMGSRFDVANVLLSGVVVGSLLGAMLSVGLLMAGRDSGQVLR